MHSIAWTLTPNYETDVNPSDLSFRQFVALLETKLRADAHWRPQADFLVYRKYDRYFDFREMGAARQELHDRIGLEVTDARAKTGHATSSYERVNGNFSDTPIRELLMMKREGKLPSLSGLVDSTLWNSLQILYAEDAATYSALAGGEPARRSCETPEPSTFLI